jgi:beta-lactamase class C
MAGTFMSIHIAHSLESPFRMSPLRLAAFCALAFFTGSIDAAERLQDQIKQVADAAIAPAMRQDDVPGVAVGITVGGKTYLFNYGVSSRKTQQPVTDSTLFEIGSITKAFTATLATYAHVRGVLDLSDTPGRYIPALRDTKFGAISLLNLGTHTPGGLPLQVPEHIKTIDQLLEYFKEWRPACSPGTCRTYSNVGIGAFGYITALTLHEDFSALLKDTLFSALRMTNSYVQVPRARMPDYAQGYTRNGAPARMADGVLAAETYGIKTTAADMMRFVEANMEMAAIDAQVQRAITDTHTGYFKVGAMTQDLVWEQYVWPVALQTLLDGNSADIALKTVQVTQWLPPQAPRRDVWINKTGSTRGFGAYVAFVPQKRIGIVILANKSYPIAARVAIAYQILMRLDPMAHASQ